VQDHSSVDEYGRFNRLFWVMILLSLLLHLGLSFLFLEVRDRVAGLNVVKPDIAEIEKRVIFELVDVPTNAEPLTHHVDTPYVSSRSARAADLSTDQSLPVAEPMSMGDFERLTEFGEQPEQSQIDELAETQPAEKEYESTESSETLSAQSREFFNEASFSSDRFKREDKVSPRPETQLVRPLRRNTESRAPSSGGFSLNTYDWEFAPYLQDMKAKIERNLYVPDAFRRMGLINGETAVRFRVYRDGHVENIQVLKTEGHESLMHSSVNSVKAAQPFKPLPSDFPADLEFLEVTALYSFINLNKK